MKTNREIRQEATTLVRSRWFGRILLSGGLLYLIAFGVAAILTVAFSDMGIQTWTDFIRAKVNAMQSGLGYTVPSTTVFLQMTGATLFEQFISYVFGAIVVFGVATLMLKAVRNDESDWFAAGFGGFRRPFGLFGLLALMNVWIVLWSLLLLVPGVMAVYRYRQAWYLKSDHPDWGAVACIAESCRMMRGFKWQAFCLDVSYFGWFLLVWLVGGLAVVLSLGESVSFVRLALGSLLGFVCFYLAARVLCALFAARAVFYRELLAEIQQDAPACAAPSPPSSCLRQ